MYQAIFIQYISYRHVRRFSFDWRIISGTTIELLVRTSVIPANKNAALSSVHPPQLTVRLEKHTNAQKF